MLDSSESSKASVVPKHHLFSRLITRATLLFVGVAVASAIFFLSAAWGSRGVSNDLAEKQKALLFNTTEGFGKIDEVTYSADYKEMSIGIILIMPDSSQSERITLGKSEVTDIPTIEKRYKVNIVEGTKIVNGERNSIVPGMSARVVADDSSAMNNTVEFDAVEIVLFPDGSV